MSPEKKVFTQLRKLVEEKGIRGVINVTKPKERDVDVTLYLQASDTPPPTNTVIIRKSRESKNENFYAVAHLKN